MKRNMIIHLPIFFFFSFDVVYNLFLINIFIFILLFDLMNLTNFVIYNILMYSIIISIVLLTFFR
jgi:hypothetical protein